MRGCTHASQSSGGRAYRPRRPRASALYQCATRHAPELKAGGGFGRHVEENVIERFLACGDPQHGFARLYCGQCRHACILAFSCKARYFCPSCHQKRVLAYGEWVESNVLAPVPHRQYVFTLPRLLRPMFARRRALLGKLCNIVERLLARAYASAGMTRALALDLAPHHITVNCVVPGTIETVRGLPGAPERPDQRRLLAPVGRRGAPEEIAAMVRMLCGPDARYITGQSIHVNGGGFMP